MKKHHTKLSGMTLVEMIVALAVFAALALILVMMGNSVEKHSRAATNLNKKVAVEGPIAEGRNQGASYLVNNDVEIKVAVGNGEPETMTGTYVPIHGSMYYIDPNSQNETDPTDHSPIPDTAPSEKDFTFKYVVVTQPTGYLTAPSTTQPAAP